MKQKRSTSSSKSGARWSRATQTARKKKASSQKIPDKKMHNVKRAQRMDGNHEHRERNLPHCPVDAQCGACQLLAFSYDDQLKQKQAEIEALFATACTRDNTTIKPILGMEDPFFYRNKVISPFAPGRRIGKQAGSKHEGRSARSSSARKRKSDRSSAERREILCGMYAKGTHRIIPTDECLIENKTAKRIVAAIRAVMMRYGVEPYDENTGKGFMRHVIVRIGHETGEVLVTLVTNGEAFPGAKNFCRELVKRCPEITTVVQNVNTRMTNVILGDGKERTLYGPGFILDRLCGLSFRISSHSFYQVNAVQTQVLYDAAIEAAALQGNERILDAYCGTGTIGLVAARSLSQRDQAMNAPLATNDQHDDSNNSLDRMIDLPSVADSSKLATDEHASRLTGQAKVAEDRETVSQVIGVDKVAAAITDARNNAKHNGITNAEFVIADAGEFMNDMAARGETLDVLFMDPPRAGASEDFLRATATLRPECIVYISCNSKTQVRDVSFLQEQGYELKIIQPVDMFPHTNHIENICVLTAI